MATAQTIIEDALKELGVLADGESATTTMLNDGLRSLNRLMELLSNEQSFAYTPSLVTMALTGQASFTIGATGADVTDDRPIAVETAWVDRATLSYPVTVIDNQKWDSIVFKTAAGANPTVIWYEPTYPNGIVHIWPISTGCALNLRVLNSVVSFAALSTTLAMPLGYEEALVKNLAVNIAPQFPAVVVSPLTLKAAKRALKVVQRTNNVVPTLQLDNALTSNKRVSRVSAIIGGY